jgi:DNA-3-methyladenine glycosylase
MKPLPRSFYQRPTLSVARDLLGMFLCRKRGSTILTGRIVEVEAYLARGDSASHSFRGRTARNDMMFRRGGLLYVYFTYGMHFCANVVTGNEGEGTAVLLRAVEPIKGLTVMRRDRLARHNRDWHIPPDHRLCSGPARLCEAFSISRIHNGTDLCGSSIWIGEDPLHASPLPALMTPRIGITKERDAPWRFAVPGHPSVSGRKQDASGE